MKPPSLLSLFTFRARVKKEIYRLKKLDNDLARVNACGKNPSTRTSLRTMNVAGQIGGTMRLLLYCEALTDSLRPSSFNWPGSTSDGASDMRQAPF
jgi:hypothetical protein